MNMDMDMDMDMDTLRILLCDGRSICGWENLISSTDETDEKKDGLGPTWVWAMCVCFAYVVGLLVSFPLRQTPLCLVWWVNT
jgi:hypothetical protein